MISVRNDAGQSFSIRKSSVLWTASILVWDLALADW
jgi:hypothetical protein